MDYAKGKYFVLTQDITIDSHYQEESSYMNFSPFAGVLDGQGHTITFDNAGAIFGSLSGRSCSTEHQCKRHDDRKCQQCDRTVRNVCIWRIDPELP